MDSKNFEKLGQQLMTYITNYRRLLETRRLSTLPDWTKIKPGTLYNLLPKHAPEDPSSFDELLQDLDTKFMPSVSHWQHPGFHAFYPGPASYPSTLGHLFTDALGFVPTTWISSPAATELEVLILDWMARALGLPKDFLSAVATKDPHHFGGGTIEASASLAVATVAIGVREHVIKRYMDRDNVTLEGRLKGQGPGPLLDRLVAYTSDQAHSSVAKGFRVAMIRSRIFKSKCIGKHLVFDPISLREAILEDINNGFIPVMCAATLGTTGTGQFERLDGLGRVCKEFGLWFHIDGAYGASALLCPEFRHLGRGLEYVDSIVVNGHKMLQINTDCTFLWLRDHRVLSMSFDPDSAYSKHDYHQMPDYMHWTLACDRKFRAMKVWFVLSLYGLSGLRQRLRLHNENAKLFENLLMQDPRFEVVNSVEFGVVSFRLKAGNKLTKMLHERIIEDHNLFLVTDSFENDLYEKNRILYLRVMFNDHCTRNDVVVDFEKITNLTNQLPLT